MFYLTGAKKDFSGYVSFCGKDRFVLGVCNFSFCGLYTFEALIKGGINDVSVGYLLNAVKNRCYNRVREFNTHQRIEELIRLECDDTTDDWPDEQTFADIRETVGKVLTESAQKIVRMRFYEGYSCKEIAKELSISENSVYKSLRNAVLTIRKKLSYNG